MPSLRQAIWFGTRFGFIVAVPLLTLLAVNQYTDRPRFDAPEWVGIVAAHVFAFGFLFAGCAVAQRVTRCAQRLRWLPLVYAFSIAVVAPAATAGFRYIQPAKEPPPPERLPTALDILLVQPSSSAFGVASETPFLTDTPPEVERWDVRFAVASATDAGELRLRLRARERGETHRRLLVTQRMPQSSGRPLPAPRLTWPGWRTTAAHAVVVNVDGVHGRALDENSTSSMPESWEPLFARFPATPPVYVILGETDDARLRAWDAWAKDRGGEAVRLRTTRETLFVDAAVRIATETRGRLRQRFVDEALVRQYRPILRFDSSEKPKPNPLDVDRLLRTGGIVVDRKKGFLALQLDKLRRDQPKLPTAIYYQVVRDPENHPGMVFLDYWWYFPYNPTPVGRDGLCEPGFMIPGVTCFDHESDWEGMTIVLVKDEKGGFVPRHAIYAQHEFGVAIEWSVLRERHLLDGDRPRAFVAMASHASYPVPCAYGCAQVHDPLYRKEGTHDGRTPWTRNDDDTCAATCLKRLPETRDGKPALWNASPLPWGVSTCIVGIWCDRAAAPRAPRYQGRFSTPWKPLDTGKVTAYFAPGRAGLPVRYAKYD